MSENQWWKTYRKNSWRSLSNDNRSPLSEAK